MGGLQALETLVEFATAARDGCEAGEGNERIGREQQTGTGLSRRGEISADFEQVCPDQKRLHVRRLASQSAIEQLQGHIEAVLVLLGSCSNDQRLRIVAPGRNQRLRWW